MTTIAIPCLLNGGTEYQTLQLVRALLQLQQQVTLVCYYEYDPEMVSLFEREGLKIELLHFPRQMGFINFILAFSRYLKKEKPSVIHIQYMTPGALPIFAAVLARVPRIIATVHQPYTALHGWKSKLILRFAANFCNPFLSVSQYTATSWFGNTLLIDSSIPINKQAKQLTLYNSVDVNKINQLISSTDNFIPMILNTNYPIIGTVSRLSIEKGIDVLIEAFNKLNKIYPNIQLLLIGDGKQRSFYETLVKELKLDQQIFFFGAADWITAMQLMSLMDIVIVPSRFEGFGLSAAEAMAMGKPVIVSNTFGLKELVDHEITGLLFENENASELSNQIVRLLNDKNFSDKIGQNAYQKVLTYFDYPIYFKNIRCLYNLDS
jgi:glycosyltransferase involved in cell wall biosynthesis